MTLPRAGTLRKGLSPRVRGNLDVEEEAEESIGSIPACAGEPAVFCLALPLTQVYPRVCGGTAGADTWRATQ